jgi:hypothetical protein
MPVQKSPQKHNSAVHEEVLSTPRRGERPERRLSTQALFDRPDNTQAAFNFDLLEIPEPVGGWTQALGDPTQSPQVDTETSYPAKPARSQSAGKGKDKTQIEFEPVEGDYDLESLHHSDTTSLRRALTNTSSNSSTPEVFTMNTWLTHQTALHSTIPRLQLEPILFKAIEATSFDFELANKVVEMMLATSSLISRPDAQHPVYDADIVIPENMKGIWTASDDNLLFSAETRDVEVVLRKHGENACLKRFEFLGTLIES